MKLSNYGYKERTTKFYPMEMGQMKNLVLQAMVRNNAEDDLVRIVCVTDGEVLEYNGMRELIGKSTFASVPTATAPAGQAMPTGPHSKRKAAACSKSWGGRLPLDTMEAVIQPPKTSRISTCTPAASAE